MNIRNINRLKICVMIGLIALCICTLPIADVLASDSSAHTTGLSRTDTSSSLTIENAVEGHTYTIYQIFSGNVENDSGSKKLTGAEWGSGVNTSALKDMPSAWRKGDNALTAEDAVDRLAGRDSSTAVSFARALTGTDGLLKDGKSITAKKSDDGRIIFSGLHPGYYLVVESGEKDGSSSNILVLVAGSVKAEAKSSTPEITKTVKVISNSGGSSSGSSINNSVTIVDGEKAEAEYTVSVKMPENSVSGHGYSDYEKYRLTIRDRSDKGISPEKDSFVVKVRTNGRTYVLHSGYSLNVKSNSFVLKFTDTKSSRANIKYTDASGTHSSGKLSELIDAGSRVSVTYRSTVDLDEVDTEGNGNENIADLTYSNDPDSDGHGTLKPVPTEIFTYRLNWKKTDESGRALAGAEFKLEKSVITKNGTKWRAVRRGSSSIIRGGGSSGNVFSVRGLGEGRYRLTEVKAPDGYSKIAPVTFRISAAYDRSTKKPVRLRVTNVKSHWKLGRRPVTLKFRTDAGKGSISTVIQDSKSIFSAPKTGDDTSLIWMIIGVCGIAAAAVLIRCRRGSRKA